MTRRRYYRYILPLMLLLQLGVPAMVIAGIWATDHLVYLPAWICAVVGLSALMGRLAQLALGD